MDTSFDLVIDAAWLASKAVVLGTLGFYLATLGNPRMLRRTVESITALNSWPATAIFRWRKLNPNDPFPAQRSDGYDAVVYNAATDEEEERPGVLLPYGWCPTILLWRKRSPQPRDAVLRVALLILLLRVLFFFAFFLGSFCLLGWLAVTEGWHWYVAMGVLAVHQVAFARTDTYIVWLRAWLYVVIGLGALVYLQGGRFETVAVCTAGGLVAIGVLGQWYVVTGERFETARRLGLGPFDPHRRRRPW